MRPPGRWFRFCPRPDAVFLVMAKTYRSLLDAIEARDYDVFQSRVRVSKWRKMLLALCRRCRRGGIGLRVLQQGPSAFFHQTLSHFLKLRITRAAFWPPKPKLVETAVRTGISRAVLGT